MSKPWLIIINHCSRTWSWGWPWNRLNMYFMASAIFEVTLIVRSHTWENHSYKLKPSDFEFLHFREKHTFGLGSEMGDYYQKENSLKKCFKEEYERNPHLQYPCSSCCWWSPAGAGEAATAWDFNLSSKTQYQPECGWRELALCSWEFVKKTEKPHWMHNRIGKRKRNRIDIKGGLA